MKIHVCRRCDGSGHVTGGYRWEIPWTRWAAGPDSARRSFLAPQPCPDCAGTGALIELEGAAADLPFASRRGLRDPGRSYAAHVAAVLDAQRMGPKQPN